ncbi:MAG: hypothetical protein Q4G27_07465 [Flavobacteriaceae bacterium]|nr:hypothetical protein [Flavobacteriaceae bacterium]
MDFSEFLVPVSIDLRMENYSRFQIGGKIRFEADEEIDEDSIVLIATNELQQFNHLEEEDFDLDPVRRHLYHLSHSNWYKKIYDLGTIYRGATFEDSCFALHQIIRKIHSKGATLLLCGGTQALHYILYKAIQKDLLRVGSIDIKIDIDAAFEGLNAENHITKMILDEDQRLLEFKSIGSQLPYVAKEEYDILEQLNFEDLRLGKFQEDFKKAEPLIRDLQLLSVDMNVMQYSSFKSSVICTSNGLNEREICKLMNYAGMSSDLKVMHISNFVNASLEDNNLLAEMLWYFIDARNNLKLDTEVDTYRVQSGDEEIVFIHSKLSDRWWIEAHIDGRISRIPCNESDYTDAMNGEIPEKWLNFYKKFY